MHDMPDPDQQELDALDAALDAIALGAPRASALTEFALEHDTASTIDHVWADASRPGSSVPDSTFVARLREELMQTSHSIPIASPVAPGERRHPHLVVKFPQVPRMRSAFGAFSTAAAIVLVVALTLISFTGSGRGIPTTVLNGLSLGPTSQENRNQEIMWGGDSGRSWNLSDDDPAYGDAARLLASVSNVQVTSALIVGDDLILTGVDSTSATGDMLITRINLRTNEAQWRIPLQTWGNMASDGERIFVFTFDPTEKTNQKPRLTAISLESGEVVWTGTDLSQVSDSPFGYGPILLGGMLYASDASGNTVAVDPKTGEQQWQYPQAVVPTAQSDIRGEDLVQSNMIGIGDAIYIVTTSRTLVKLDRRTGEELLTMNLPDRFGSDVRSISLQASDSDLLVTMTRPLGAESNDSQRLNEIPGTLARVRASDFFIEWQSVTNLSGGNRVSQANVMMTSSGKSPTGPFFLYESDPTGKAGRVFLADDPEELLNLTGTPLIAMVSGVGNSVIAYGEGNTVTIFPNASLLFTPTPDANTTSQVPTISMQLPGKNGPPILPPLIWGNVPVIVTMTGSIWALDGKAPETTTPTLAPVATLSNDSGTVSTPVAASPVATSGDDADRYAETLNPASVTLKIQVDVDGILNEDATAIANAQNELNRVLAPYVDGSSCKIGFALISTRSNDLGTGIQVSDAIATIITEDFPELLPTGPNGSPGTLTSESIALPGSVPIGEVQIQLFLNNGCKAWSGTPTAG